MPTKYQDCPLCFQKLDLRESVYVSRPADRRRRPKLELRPEPQEVNCGNLSALTAEDEKYGDPRNGIFLAHKGCNRLNPFCKEDGSGTVIDFGQATQKSNEGVIPEYGIKVRHWEVGILKCMSPNVIEMWFPAALLKVTMP